MVHNYNICSGDAERLKQKPERAHTREVITVFQKLAGRVFIDAAT